jgi:hypothetical protein
LPGAVEYLDAFRELSTDRQIGMATGQIPSGAIDRYAMRHGLDDPDEFELFTQCVRAMDAVYLGVAKEPATAPEPTARPLSVELFDALF